MRIALVNQFYAPDLAPTAQLAASLAAHRAARGDQVTVVTGRAGYLQDVAPTSPTDGAAAEGATAEVGEGGTTAGDARGPRVRRVWTPGVGRASALRRVAGYAAFLAGSAARLAVMPRQDVIVVMTTPPYVVLAALAHKVLRRGHPAVVLWSMDCYPEAAERLGALPPGSRVARALRALNRRLMARIDHVVALDGAMADLLAAYAAGPGRPPITVIPNWEPAALFPPGAPPPRWAGWDDLDLARADEPEGHDRPAVVLYLGNTGVGHRFDTVLDAAEVLGGEVLFLFVGGGARWTDLADDARHRGLGNVVLRGYVPKDETPAVMAGADVALITLDDRSLGVMSPSKLHANLAAGLPVLYVGPPGSNVDEAIERYGCGTSVRHGDVDGLVAAVRALRADPGRAADQRRRARAAFEDAYSDERTLPCFDAVLDRLA